MTSAIEYSVIWDATAPKAPANQQGFYAADVERIVASAHAARAAMIADAFAQLGKKLAQGLRHWRAAQKRRAAASQLLAMDDRLLRDIGLTRAEVPLVVCGLASGEVPDVFANAHVMARNTQANENSRNHAA